MHTLSKRNQSISESARDKRLEVIDKSFLIIRPDNLPMFLKPIRTMIPVKCAFSGETIHVGEYAYPCYINPLRLTPNGNMKIMIHHAEQQGEKILPQGYVLFRIPTYENIVSRRSVQELERERRALLEKEATKLIKEGSWKK